MFIGLVNLFTAFAMAGSATSTTISGTAKRGTQVEKKDEVVSTKEVMNEFLVQMMSLKKYLISEESFTNPKNENKILFHLKAFADASKKSFHDPDLSRKNFQFSRDVLQSHISEIERVYRLGNKSYARWMLNSTFSVCTSCHTQVPTQSRAFSDFYDANLFSSEFDKAEFLFMTRVYDQGFNLYDKLIKSYPASLSADELETSLKRVLFYFTRILRNPTQGEKLFLSYAQLPKLAESTQNKLKDWARQLSEWKSVPIPDLAKATDADIQKFIKQHLESENRNRQDAVLWLTGSGVLFEYLKDHSDSKLAPEILYWLAICDKYINYSFFFSLSDLFLRECIVQYSNQPIAKKCYDEFEGKMLQGYSGSSGVHLPSDVKKDLDQLKKLVTEGAKKIPKQKEKK